MTVDQAVKKFKLEPLNVYTAKAKAKELNVEEVLYMNVQKNKYAYIVKDGARGYVLYQDDQYLLHLSRWDSASALGRSAMPEVNWRSTWI